MVGLNRKCVTFGVTATTCLISK